MRVTIEEAVCAILQRTSELAEAEGGQRLLHASRQYFHIQRHTFSAEQAEEIDTLINN